MKTAPAPARAHTPAAPSSDHEPVQANPAAPTADAVHFTTLVEAATGTPFRPGNRFDILQNGDEIFPAMLAAIRTAQTSIEFVTYVYWSSNIATEFANALCERARAGVAVRLLVDAVGGAVMNTRTVWQLERAGVKVAWFRPARFKYLRRLNNRTHRKVLVIDGGIGFVGGVGIAEEWTGQGDDPKHWRETHCRISGPACADLFDSFAENWLEATGEKLKRGETEGTSAPHLHHLAGHLIAVHTESSTAGPRPTTAERLFLGVIAAAQHQLHITTAYFVPNVHLQAALTAAARRGVTVRILTNGPLSNHRLTQFAGRATYQRLLDAGIHIFEYQGTVLHSKVLTVDSAWATICSTNLDDRSLILNDELGVSVVDPGTIAQLDRRFEADLARSQAIRNPHWAGRGLPGRLAETAASLFRHQL